MRCSCYEDTRTLQTTLPRPPVLCRSKIVSKNMESYNIPSIPVFDVQPWEQTLSGIFTGLYHQSKSPTISSRTVPLSPPKKKNNRSCPPPTEHTPPWTRQNTRQNTRPLLERLAAPGARQGFREGRLHPGAACFPKTRCAWVEPTLGREFSRR